MSIYSFEREYNLDKVLHHVYDPCDDTIPGTGVPSELTKSGVVNVLCNDGYPLLSLLLSKSPSG